MSERVHGHKPAADSSSYARNSNARYLAGCCGTRRSACGSRQYFRLIRLRLPPFSRSSWPRNREQCHFHFNLLHKLLPPFLFVLLSLPLLSTHPSSHSHFHMTCSASHRPPHHPHSLRTFLVILSRPAKLLHICFHNNLFFKSKLLIRRQSRRCRF